MDRHDGLRWAEVASRIRKEKRGEDPALLGAYFKAKVLDEGLHRIFERLKKSSEDDPPPEESKRLARNAKRAIKRLMNKRYKSSRFQKFVEKIKRGSLLVYVRQDAECGTDQ